MIAAILLFMTLLFPSVVAAQIWPNEPTNGVIISDHNFTVCEANGWTGNCGFIRSDPTAPLSPSSIMRWEYNTSTGFGGGEVSHPLNVTQVYIGYLFKLSNPFEGADSGANKMTFGWDGDFGHGYWTKAFGAPGGGPFFVEFHLQGTDSRIDNCHTGGYGECFNRAWDGPTPITLGVWHRVELYYKHSSCMTCQNGVAKVWLDNRLEIDLSTLNTPDGMIVDVTFTPTWTPPVHRSNPDQHSFDHVRVSTCTNCTFGGPDITPPNPVTGITVE